MKAGNARLEKMAAAVVTRVLWFAGVYLFLLLGIRPSRNAGAEFPWGVLVFIGVIAGVVALVGPYQPGVRPRLRLSGFQKCRERIRQPLRFNDLYRSL